MSWVKQVIMFCCCGLFATFTVSNAAPRLASVLAQLKQLEQQNNGRLGIMVVDRLGQPYLAYHANQRFPFCSTAKVIAVAKLLSLREQQPSLLKQKVLIRPEDLTNYNPITQQFVGKSMNYFALSAAALQYSDNSAMNLLIQKVGGKQAINQYVKRLGDKVFRLDRLEPELNSAIPGDLRDTTSPQAMANTLQKIVFGNGLTANNQQLLIYWMQGNTTGDHSIKAGLSNNYQVADKTGSGAYGTTNDIAIIWPPHQPPLIMVAFFTQWQPQARARPDILATSANIISQLLPFIN